MSKNFSQWRCSILVTLFPSVSQPVYCIAIGLSDVIQTIGTIYKYDLFNTTILIQNLVNICFCIFMTQFYINFLRQEHQIDVLMSYMYPLTPKILRFHPISLSFFLYKPFNFNIYKL